MIEHNKIYNADCFDIFPNIDDQSIDLILCDLPYSLTRCKWDKMLDLERLWESYNRIIKPNAPIVLTASQPFTSILVSSNLKAFGHEWIWIKEQGTNFLNAKYQPLKNHESVLVFCNNTPNYYPQMTDGHKPYVSGKGQSTDLTGQYTKIQTHNSGTRYPKTAGSLKFNRESKPIHSTQKPVPLFEYLINTYSKEHDLVLDNCSGAGTTAIAAMTAAILCPIDQFFQNGGTELGTLSRS